MKKLLFGMVLSLMVVFLLGGALLVFADDGENFEKAGQQALEEREEVLIEEKTRLERIVQVIAEDRVITTDEMIALRNEVKIFNQLKERYDKELELYGKKTSTALGEGYGEAIYAYIEYHTLFKQDDPEETVRAFFATETGQDVEVKRGAAVCGGACVAFMVATIISFVLTIGAAIELKNKWAILPGVFFIIFLLILLLQ